MNAFRTIVLTVMTLSLSACPLDSQFKVSLVGKRQPAPYVPGKAFEFNLSSSEVEIGDDTLIKWPESDDLLSMTIEVKDEAGNLVVRLSDIKTTSKTNLQVSKRGRFSVQLFANLKSGAVVASVVKSLQTKGVTAPSIAMPNTDVVLGDQVSINPTSLITSNLKIKNCSVSPALPSWASINSETCVITGVAGAVMSRTDFIVTVTNEFDESGSSSFSITVNTNRTYSVDFAADKSMTPRIGPPMVFSRSSSATRFNELGEMVLEGANTPRFEHSYINGSWVSSGLIINPERTNTATESNNFLQGNWNWISEITRTSGIQGIFGSYLPFTRLETTAVSGPHSIASSWTSYNGDCNSQNCSFSVFVKPEGVKKIRMGNLYYYESVLSSMDFSFETESFIRMGPSCYPSRASKLPDNTWHFQFSFQRPGQIGGYITGVMMLGDASEINWVGDPSKSISIAGWNSYNHVPPIPRSYIPTGATPVTHTADQVVLSGSDFASVYNQNEGLFELEFNVLGLSGVQGLFSLNDDTANNRIEIFAEDSALKFRVVKNGVSTPVQSIAATVSVDRNYKLKFAYSRSEFKFQLDDLSPLTFDGPFELPSVTQWRLGQTQAGQVISANFARFHYVPKFPKSIQNGW